MTSDLIISNVNAVYVHIECNEGLALELKDKFTFMTPGAQFHPLFKKKHWDGKIRLWNNQYHVIYRGLVPKVIEFAKENNYTWSYKDETDGKNVADSKSFIETSFIETLRPKYTPRPYQMDAFLRAIQNNRILLVSPTASGKSLIIYLILNYLLSQGLKKALIIVPTVNLVEQMSADFIDYSELNKLPFDKIVHKIYEGHEKYSDKPVTISTWQSLYTQPPEFFEQFDIVFGDEAHQFKANSIKEIMTALVNAEYRIGTTGTLDGTKVHELVLEGLFGPKYVVTTTHKLMKDKHVADFRIKCILLEHPESAAQTMVGKKYHDEIEYLVFNSARSRYITNLTTSLSGNTLVLFQYVKKHGETLLEMIEEKLAGTDRKVFFVYGKTEVEVREAIRAIVEKETEAIIVASFGTFSTGINIRNLHNIIFASPSKSRIRVLQSIGRALRTSDTKDSAILFDIADDLRYKSHDNITIGHFRERLKLYAEEKFPFKIYKVKLKET